MEIQKDTNVTVIKGDLQFYMGKGMTTFRYKGQDKFVFRTSEVPDIINMLQAAKEALDKSESCATVVA